LKEPLTCSLKICIFSYSIRVVDCLRAMSTSFWGVRNTLLFKRGIHTGGKKPPRKGVELAEGHFKSLSYQNSYSPSDASCVETANAWKLFFPRSRYEATTLEGVERIFLETLDEQQREISLKTPENKCFTQSKEYGTGDVYSHSEFSFVPSKSFPKRLTSELARAFDFGALYSDFGSEEIVYQASPVASRSDRIQTPRSTEYWYYYCTHEEDSVKNTAAPGLKVETQSMSDRFVADIISAVDRYNQRFSNVEKHSFKYLPEEDSNDNETS